MVPNVVILISGETFKRQSLGVGMRTLDASPSADINVVPVGPQLVPKGPDCYEAKAGHGLIVAS